MGKTLNIGIDVGNFDTKSQNTTTPSGFVEYTDAPFGVNEYLEYNGKYYAPSTKRFPYVKDKTSNDNMFILTLISLSKEIICKAERDNAKKVSDAETDKSKKDKILGVQGEIDLISDIKLGVGVPVSDYGRFKKSYENYYKERMKEPLSYRFGGYDFKINLAKIVCYAQDVSVVVTYKSTNDDSVLNSKRKTYYAVDIGGWTIDIVTVVDNSFEGKGVSKPLGVLAMYEIIINEVDVQTGVQLEVTDVEAILKEDETCVSVDVRNIVFSQAQIWFNRIVDEMVQNGILIGTRPVVFIGGGSQLFKRFIKECGRFAKCEFIPNQKANARGYAKMIGTP